MNKFLMKNNHILVLSLALFCIDAHAVEFNTDLLNANDKKNIDISMFSNAGFIMPGTYSFDIYLNKTILTENAVIKFVALKDNTEACLTRELVEKLGLRKEYKDRVLSHQFDGCYNLDALEGAVVKGDLSKESLTLAIAPQMLEYHDANWLPPAYWDNGLTGMILDYNMNLNTGKNQGRSQSQTASTNGTLGFNAGAWRFRGDYQGNYSHLTGHKRSTRQTFDWDRFYAYRALPEIQSALMLGEDNLTSDIFDSWRYRGVSLASDQKQLPPALRGYAPEVNGIARTNATVTVSQQGRVIYETVVAEGPFTIQQLSTSTSGLLDVDIKEQDGSTQHYQVMASSLPYLTRPGQTQYKLALGRPEDRHRHTSGELFVTSEMSRGLSGEWSTYAGAILSGDYKSAALGVARSLGIAGVVSADITHAETTFKNSSHKGESYRLKYYKNFEQLNSTFTVSGIQYSDSDFFSMSDYINNKNNWDDSRRDRSQYSVSLTKNFSEQKMSLSANFLHKTYWAGGNNDSYSLNLSKYIDFHEWKNITFSLSAVRNNYYRSQDDMVYLNLSIPLGNGTVSYSNSISRNNINQLAGWYQQLHNGDSYRLQTGIDKPKNNGAKGLVNGFYYHNGSLANMSANVSWKEDNYTSAGMNINGGITATTKGVAMHPSGNRGATRVMIGTDGIADVPLGRNLVTNGMGIAVQAGVSSYSRVRSEVDVTRLPEDIEVIGSPVAEQVLTNGAIGFKSINVIKGLKLAATLRLRDGSPVPFGTSVLNKNGVELGIVGDNGLTWLSGITANQALTAKWNGATHCTIVLPAYINPQNMLLLPCEE
ncbi:fimbria/pilus outer membrane usher protein [Cedecea sp. P7760]|uniref:fimbria/pilus outer membrane usher protein n=1 Tax=Cedecea sp. P7760 TaxID=2726983 RepID=UPI0015A4D09F|nr:fimbria/pilus outer membrane usher protein [Cedecea sp. P7760]NWC64458.1 fimbria/pilus outer membrane usher protein [Cedecea sp. P7760]